MQFEPSNCPECNEEPAGTLEDLTACAEFEKQPDGSYEYSGYTEVYWDSQMTRTVHSKQEGSKVVLLCDNGHDWEARQL